MKRLGRSARLAGILSLLVLAVSFAQTKTGKTEKKQTPPATAPASFVEEKGHFRILLDGQPAGTEEFQIAQSGKGWVARGSSEVPAASGGNAKVSGRLELAADGTPLHYEWTSSLPKKSSATVQFSDGSAKMELRLEGLPPFPQEFTFDSPRVVILDNNLYHHYAVLARIYDWKTKGPQTFPVLIPQDATPGSILLEYAGAKVVEGVKLETLRLRSTDLELEMDCEGARLVRVYVPASKAEIIREP
jgi:hypothetical protein